MKTQIAIISILSVLYLSYLGFTNISQNQNFIQKSKISSQNMLGNWTGFLALQIPQRNEFCLYQIDYQTIQQDNGQFTMTGNSVNTYSQFLKTGNCKKYTSNIKGFLNQEYTRFFFEQDATGQTYFNYYGQTTGDYIIGYNLDVETFQHYDYTADFDVYHTLIMYNENTQNENPQVQQIEQMVQDFQLFAEIENKKDFSCSELEGLWQGISLTQDKRNYSNCLYQTNVQIDGTDRILRIIGQGVDGQYASKKGQQQSECQNIDIEFIGDCSESDQSVLLNGEKAQAVYNQDQVILQTKQQMLVLTRQ